MRRKIRQAIEEPGLDIDADTVFERLERLNSERMKADGGASNVCRPDEGGEGSALNIVSSLLPITVRRR